MDVHEIENENPAQLLAGVVHDARELASAEIDKVKAEAGLEFAHLKRELHQLNVDAKLAGAALAVIIVSSILVGAGLALGFAALVGWPAWTGFLIVGGIGGLLGAFAVRRAMARAEREANDAEARAKAAAHGWSEI
ncbi:MAG TPA: hypothetical protein VGM88_31225 [Kofleriaceae bacterium]|jgi:F0F1-type ATP synthase assembly protein I